jgi:TIGR02594 family protein
MINRRQFLQNTTLALLLSRFPNLRAEEILQEDGYDDFFSLNIPTLEQLGTQHPKPEKVKKATEILSLAPRDKGLVGIFSYFANLNEKTEDTNESYNAGWKNEWNPVIVTFFQETSTKPSGDETPWCAASLCWCLKETGYKHPKNASSSSFRKWGSETKTPSEGDIVVFGSRDKKKYNEGKGHVGVYLKEENGKILVLGGNQITKHKHHVVNEKWIPKDDPNWPLKFHSYRSLSSLA